MNDKITIGFLPLYLDLYHSTNPKLLGDFLAFVDEIHALIRRDGIDVETVPPVYKESNVRRAADHFTSVDAIVTLHLCYSPSLLVSDYLASSGKRLIILDVTPDSSMAKMADDFLMKNHGIHGVMDLTSVLYSKGVDYTVISGHPSGAEFTSRLSACLDGIRAAKRLKNQTIGITGKPFGGMGDFAIEFETLKERLGIATAPIDKKSILRATREVSAAAIEEQRQRDREAFTTSTVDPDVYMQEITSYIAIRELLDRNGATGYTMNFQHVIDDIPVPFYACSRLQSHGYGYAGEGDVLTAALGHPLNGIAISKFDEFFCPDWDRDGILMSHMGETDPRFAAGEVSLATRTGFINQMESVIFRFKALPGEVTFVNLTPGLGGELKVVTGLLEIIDYPILDKVEGPHYVVRTPGKLTTFLERYAQVGGGHHLYISRGNIVGAVSSMCKSLDFPCHVVDVNS